MAIDVTFGIARKGLGGAAARPGSSSLPNVTVHPSTASVLLYNGPLLCGFNVPIKRLTKHTIYQPGLLSRAGFVAAKGVLYTDGKVGSRIATDLIGTHHTRSYLSDDVVSASLHKYTNVTITV